MRLFSKACSAILFTLIPLASLAESCPSVKDIKQNTLPAWSAYDSDDDTALNEKQFTRFKESIERFALAEWQQDKQHGSMIHCYYRDKSGSEMETYLAKPHLVPDNSHNRWYSVSGSWHCAADSELCAFKAGSVNTLALRESISSRVHHYTSKISALAKSLFSNLALKGNP